MNVDTANWEQIDESTLKVGDVIMWWPGGTVRRVTDVTMYAGPNDEHCVGIATCTGATPSGLVQFSMWKGQTVWRLR